MSNKRRLRRPAAKKDRIVEQPQRPGVPPPRQVRTALYHQERIGMVERGGKLEPPPEGGRPVQWWKASSLAMEHGYDCGATVTVQSRRETAAGLLKARLTQADGIVRQGDIVRIVHPATGSEGAAHVRRVVARTGLMFLESHWGVAPQQPRHRTQAEARAMAREQPDPCPACGRPQGEDCVTRDGKRAAWPHAGRDPLLSREALGRGC